MTHTKPQVIAPLTAATLIAQQVGGTGMRDGLFLSHFPVKAFRISWQVQPSSRSLHHSSRDVTYERLSHEMGFWNVEGSSAYAVISGITIKGQSVVRTGTLAHTFAKRDDARKIEAQAWGRRS